MNYEVYPLHVEYFLTPTKGREIFKAFKIMQSVGIEYMMENGMEEELKKKASELSRRNMILY